MVPWKECGRDKVLGPWLNQNQNDWFKRLDFCESVITHQWALQPNTACGEGLPGDAGPRPTCLWAAWAMTVLVFHSGLPFPFTLHPAAPRHTLLVPKAPSWGRLCFRPTVSVTTPQLCSRNHRHPGERLCRTRIRDTIMIHGHQQQCKITSLPHLDYSLLHTLNKVKSQIMGKPILYVN